MGRSNFPSEAGRAGAGRTKTQFGAGKAGAPPLVEESPAKKGEPGGSAPDGNPEELGEADGGIEGWMELAGMLMQMNKMFIGMEGEVGKAMGRNPELGAELESLREALVKLDGVDQKLASELELTKSARTLQREKGESGDGSEEGEMNGDARQDSGRFGEALDAPVIAGRAEMEFAGKASGDGALTCQEDEGEMTEEEEEGLMQEIDRLDEKLMREWEAMGELLGEMRRGREAKKAKGGDDGGGG